MSTAKSYLFKIVLEDSIYSIGVIGENRKNVIGLTPSIEYFNKFIVNITGPKEMNV